MSILDSLVDAMTPTNKEPGQREEARAKARSLSTKGDWLWLVVDHHEQIDKAFATVLAAKDAPARRAAQHELALLLTAHSLAEEAVIYPAISMLSNPAQASQAYSEQSSAKVQMAMLETLDPMQPAFVDKLDRLRGAIAHHVQEEESVWLPQLQKACSEADRNRLSQRYLEEFNRYMSGGPGTLDPQWGSAA